MHIVQCMHNLIMYSNMLFRSERNYTVCVLYMSWVTWIRSGNFSNTDKETCKYAVELDATENATGHAAV